MSTKKAEWYVDERVRALAIMHLTRRDDLVIRDETRDEDLLPDLAVEIVDPKKIGRRTFAVALQGTTSAVDEAHANKILRPSLRRLHSYGPTPYPVCLFYFTMEDNQGYFTWVSEPIVENGRERLRAHTEAHCAKLDRAALDHIVQQVNDWYDAFYRTVTMN